MSVHLDYDAYLFAMNEPKWSHNCPYDFGTTAEYIDTFAELRAGVISTLVCSVLASALHLLYCYQVLKKEDRMSYPFYWSVDAVLGAVNLALSIWVLVLGSQVRGFVTTIHEWRCSDDATMKLFDDFHDEIAQPFLFNILKVSFSGAIFIYNIVNVLVFDGLEDPADSCN